MKTCDYCGACDSSVGPERFTPGALFCRDAAACVARRDKPARLGQEETP